MADSTIGISEPLVPNKLLDSESVVVGLNTVERERVQIAGDSATDIAPVTAADGLLVNLGANNDVTVTGTVTATGPLTDTELRATPVPVSLTSTTITGTVAVTQSGVWDEVGINDSGNSITVDAVNLDIRDLTFAADKVDVSGSTAVGVTGPLTDAQLRATPVPISGTVTVTDGAGALNVIVDSGTLTAVTTITNPVAVTQSGTWDEVGINDSGNSITVDGSVTAIAQPGVDIGDVTINNAAGAAAVNIQDGGNVITVDGAVTVSASDLDIRDLSHTQDSIRIGDGTDIVDVLDLTNSNPLTVAIVDGSGTQITSFGGGTQYTEGDVDTTITGMAVMWEDTGDTLRSVSAATPLPTDGSGVTQPISAASLPLPTDASTETTQLLVLAALGGSSTPLYSTIDDTRRLQELTMLEAMKQSYFLMAQNEPDGREPRGFELR